MNPAHSVYKLPLSINASVDTMMEHLAIKRTPVAADSRNKLIAIHRSQDNDIRHKTDLIGVRQQPHPDLKNATQTILMHYFEDDTSASGWSHEETPLEDVYDPGSKEKLLSGVRELSGFHQNGITYLFVQYQSPSSQNSYSVKILWSVMENGRPVWQEKKWDHRGDDARSVLSSVRQLSIHRRNDGQHILYGVTRGFGDPELARGEEEFFMIIPRKPADLSAITHQDIAFDTLHDSDHEIPNWDGIENASIYQLATPLDGEADRDENRYTLLRLRNGKIEFHTTRVLPVSRFYAQPRLSFDRGSVLVDSQGVDLSSARIFSVPAGPEDALLVHQPSGDLGILENIHSAQPGYRSLLQEAGPADIDRLSIGVVGHPGSTDASLAIFATPAGQNTLWLLRLDAHASQSSWVCLGDQVSDIACPRIMPDGAELFQVSPQAGKIEFKRQHPQTYSWTTNELAVATSDLAGVTPINAHVVDIEVTDANFIPCPHREITLTSDTPCLLYIDGVTYRVGPRLPLTLTSNGYGRIRGVIPADGLKAPVFTVNTADAAAIRVYPNGRLSERLAGNAKGFNVSKSIAELAPAEHRTAVNQLIKSYGDAASKSKRGVNCDGTLRKQYRLSSQGNGLFVDETSAGNTLSAVPLEGFAGDILNHIRQGFNDIKQMVVRVFDASVEFLIQTGNEILKFTNSVFDSIVDGFEALADFLSEVFEKLGDVVKDIGKKILDAVSFVFGGKDVFAANDALQSTIKSGFMTTSSNLVKLGTRMNSEYQRHIDIIDEHLDSLIDQSQKAKNVRSASAEQGMSFGGVDIPAPSALVKTNRAGSDIMGGNQGKFDEASPDVSAEKTEADVINNLLKKLRSNYEKDVAGVIRDIGDKLSSDSSFLEKLSSMPLEIIRLLKGVIKTIAKLSGDVLEAAVKLIDILLSRLFEAFESKIDIPVLNTLVQLWSGDNERKLSYFDIITLPFAFIGTAIWKIVSGKAIVTSEMNEEYIPWVDNLPAVMDFSSVGGPRKKVKHRSLGAAAVSDESTDPSDSFKNIYGFLEIMAALTIIAALAGILVGMTAQPVATVAEITTTSSGPAGVVVMIMTLIPVLLVLTQKIVTLFYEIYEGIRIPSGESLNADEKAKNTGLVILIFAIIAVAMLIAIIGVVVKIILKIPGYVVNTILNVLSIIAGVGLLGYAVYNIVEHAISHGNNGNDEHLWGIGLEAASGVGSLISVAATICVIIASNLIKGEVISGAVMTAVAVGLQTTSTIISKGATIIEGGRTAEALAKGRPKSEN